MLLRYPRDSSCKLIDFGRSFFVAGAAELKERVSLLFVDRCSTVVRVVVTGASLARVAGQQRRQRQCQATLQQHGFACESEEEARNSTRRDSADDPNMQGCKVNQA